MLNPPANKPLAMPTAMKWHYNVVAIGNAQGYNQYMPLHQPGWYDQFQQAVTAALPDPDKSACATFRPLHALRPSWVPAPSEHCARWEQTATKRFGARPEDMERAVCLPPPHASLQGVLCPPQCSSRRGATNLAYGHAYEQWQGARQAMVDEEKLGQASVPPLLHDWKSFVYTDGSLLGGKQTKGPGIGAAVYVPGHEPIPIDCAWGVEGADPTHCNTISRAEMAAIHVAITTQWEVGHRPDGSLHIATDSLGSMYGVARAITRPQDLREHRHATLLMAIANAIRDAPGPVHLWKVPSHCGIVGNEKADEIAVAVARGKAEAVQEYETPSNNRASWHWPHRPSSKEDRLGCPTTVHHPIADLNDALRQVAHERNKLGTAKKDGVYASSWNKADPLIHHASSHLFMTSPEVTNKARKTVLQYRWGLLPTARWMKKIGKCSHGLCPLCGQEDGGHHAVSACPRMSPAITNRHNDAGTEILEAISKGSKASDGPGRLCFCSLESAKSRPSRARGLWRRLYGVSICAGP